MATTRRRGLNPCSNGRLSENLELEQVFTAASLNPCSNGRLSEVRWAHDNEGAKECLNPCSNGRLSE